MADRNYGALRSAAQFEAFADRIISSGKPFGFDIESGYSGPDREGTALQNFHPLWFLVGFSFTNSTEWARYVPIKHDDGDNVDDVVRTAKALWRMLQSGMAVAHNAPFELRGTGRWFVEVLGDDPELGEEIRACNGMFPILSDTMVETFLSGKYHPLTVGQDLKSLTKHVFGHQMILFADLFPDLPAAKRKRARFNTLSLTPEVITYACEDSVWCLALHQHPDHYEALKDSLVFRTEIALIPVLVEMEREGMMLDWKEISRRAEESKILAEKMNEEIQKNLSERLGETIAINLGSTKQLSEVLFERMGLPIKERSEKTNEPSTSEKALRSIAQVDPVVKKILQYREIIKLHGSYLHKYATQLNYADDGRAHPNHKQTGAATGRMSVDGVSYQQWPKPYHYELEDGTVFDLNFRNLLIAPEGSRIIGFDYSQVELRVLAGQANETALLKAFADGTDIHVATASNMMGIPIEAVDKKTRAKGKTLNFAVVYGSGAANIAEMLTKPDDPVTTEDAEELLEKYYAAFSGLRSWMDERIVEGRQQGYVTNMFGRKFTVWEFQDSRNWIRAKGDRMCVNAPIQGGAADYAKIAMIRADKAIKKAGLEKKIRMFMMIHDALEFYVSDDVDTQTVLDILGPAVSYRVPGLPEIRADWHECKRWGEPVEISRDSEGKITHYSIEDVDQKFFEISEAYAYFENKNAAGSEEKAPAPVEKVQEAPQTEIHTLVTISQMPDANQWELFKRFMAQHAGLGTLTLNTPEGSVDFQNVRLTKQDQPAVSSILGGATLSQVHAEMIEIGDLAL